MWQSRKFRILCADALFATILLITVTFLAPEWSDFAIKMVAILQAPIVALIAGIAIEDAGYKASGKFPHG